MKIATRAPRHQGTPSVYYKKNRYPGSLSPGSKDFHCLQAWAKPPWGTAVKCLTTVILCVLIILAGNCKLFKPKFNPVAHQYAVSIQKDAPALMDKANQSFSLHKEDVYRLMTRVEKAYEYSRLLYKNKKITGLWNLLRSPSGNRLGQFMQEWEKEDILSSSYIEDNKKTVMETLKLLVQLEEGKKK
jgi:hypothetical protein